MLNKSLTHLVKIIEEDTKRELKDNLVRNAPHRSGNLENSFRVNRDGVEGFDYAFRVNNRTRFIEKSMDEVSGQ